MARDGYTRHIRKLPFLLDPPVSLCPIRVSDSPDKLGDAYDIFLSEEDARGFIAQLILGEIIGVVKVFDIQDYMLSLEMLCRFHENASAFCCGAVGESALSAVQDAVNGCDLKKDISFSGMDIALSMLIQPDFTPAEQVSPEICALWRTYLDIRDVVKIWESTELRVRDIAAASELTEAIRAAAHDNGIDEMLSAFVAGVPLRDVIAGGRNDI